MTPHFTFVIIAPMRVTTSIVFLAALGWFYVVSPVSGQEGEEPETAEPAADEETPPSTVEETPPVEEPTAVSYATKEYGIYFDVPAGWVLNKKPASGLVEVASSLGYATVNIAVRILDHRTDVVDFVEKQEGMLGWRGGLYAVDVLAAGTLAPDESAVLESFVLDDRKATEKKREKWEKEQAEKAADAGLDEARFESLTEERPSFYARVATKIYDFPEKGTKYLVYYVIGGGVGYRITVSAERDGFYAMLPLGRDIIDGIDPAGLKGGRYALPSETQMRAVKKGLIIGKVLSNGVPVAGVKVFLYETKSGYERGDPIGEARSNHYGEYVLTSLRPGTYYLLEAAGADDEGTSVRSLQPITNIDVEPSNAVSINVEVVPE
ncbi:MAG: carboxypeptidase regulatory-like domain-containing protein [Candidatus Coatesbacteria bacterium]|nr:MAG: carboxypeptidase regulatory-like domain-containing protein [Candidatus Coatesbacteria bacterium]